LFTSILWSILHRLSVLHIFSSFGFLVFLILESIYNLFLLLILLLLLNFWSLLLFLLWIKASNMSKIMNFYFIFLHHVERSLFWSDILGKS
jgi:hypothetical protein